MGASLSDCIPCNDSSEFVFNESLINYPPKVSVFVRVRPLTSSEVDNGQTLLRGLYGTAIEGDDVSDDMENKAVAFAENNLSVGGFTGVLGPSTSNQQVFDTCFKTNISTVLRGGYATFFAHGYTGIHKSFWSYCILYCEISILSMTKYNPFNLGGGKTHTILGYSGESGVFSLAADNLLRALKQKAIVDKSGETERLFLHATACEIYNDKVFDLLSPSRNECTLRSDANGQMVISGPPSSLELPESESGLGSMDEASRALGGIHSTIVTTAEGLHPISVMELSHLNEMAARCVGQRSAGTSTEHAQSSRSHAMLRVEVVSERLLAIKSKVGRLKGMIPARQNARDNNLMAEFRCLYEAKQVLRSNHDPCKDEMGLSEWNMFKWKESDFEIDSSADSAVGGQVKAVKLLNYKSEGAKTVEGWSAFLGLDLKHIIVVRNLQTVEGSASWEEKYQTIMQERAMLDKLVEESKKQHEEALIELEKVLSESPPCLGGSMLLVDLAGADYDHRSGNKQKESAAINKSLLALKECLRCLASTKNKPKFRDSKLTRVLEDSLSPSAATSRHNKESTTVMIVNVSPSAHLKKMTMNSLRYGQIFSAENRR